MDDLPLRHHPLLAGHTPGTTPYTQALRALLPIITRGKHCDPQDLGRWQALRDRHLKLVEADARADHTLALTPRAMLGGFELSAYAAGCTVLVVAALMCTALLPQLNDILVQSGSVVLGMITVVLVNHRYTTLRREALDRLDLRHAEDPPNLTGSHL